MASNHYYPGHHAVPANVCMASNPMYQHQPQQQSPQWPQQWLPQPASKPASNPASNPPRYRGERGGDDRTPEVLYVVRAERMEVLSHRDRDHHHRDQHQHRDQQTQQQHAAYQQTQQQIVAYRQQQQEAAYQQQQHRQIEKQQERERLRLVRKERWATFRKLWSKHGKKHALAGAALTGAGIGLTVCGFFPGIVLVVAGGVYMLTALGWCLLVAWD